VADEFVKFPRTPHLFWLGQDQPRGDKLVDSEEVAKLLRRPVVVEEKIDGAGIGISLDSAGVVRVQSRGDYLERGVHHPQFRPLWGWLDDRAGKLQEALGSHLIVFGEWCYARHTVGYDALPDWFLAFDVYDQLAGRFWAHDRRDELASRVGVAIVPQLATGRFDRAGLQALLGRSRLGSEPMEGLYLRWEERPWLSARAKLVRASWIPLDEAHWSGRPLIPNRRMVDHAVRLRRASHG
jgi:hypothetical protein